MALSNNVNEVLTAVLAMAQEACGKTIYIGPLLPAGGISAFVTSGGPRSTFFNKGMAYELSIVIEAKEAGAQTAFDELNAIHQSLSQATEYPTGTGWKITNIETVGTPFYSGRGENSLWIYTSSLLVKFHFFKEEH
nr:MAG TPA: Minor capsid protein from bacteriophage [Caudoviricetes sp.]